MAVQLLEDWLLKEQDPNNLSGTQSSPSEGARLDLYRRLDRGVFSHS